MICQSCSSDVSEESYLAVAHTIQHLVDMCIHTR